MNVLDKIMNDFCDAETIEPIMEGGTGNPTPPHFKGRLSDKSAVILFGEDCLIPATSDRTTYQGVDLTFTGGAMQSIREIPDLEIAKAVAPSLVGRCQGIKVASGATVYASGDRKNDTVEVTIALRAIMPNEFEGQS